MEGLCEIMKEQGHIIDLHCDTLFKIQEDGGDFRQILENSGCLDVSRLKQSGYWLQFFAAFIEAVPFSEEAAMEEGYQKALEMFDIFDRACTWQPEKLCKVTSRKGALEARDAGRIGGILTVEEGGILNGKRERIDHLYDRGVRLITLLWNYENCLGFPNSPSASVMEKGLKAFGIETVEYMEEKGMLIDVSHMNDGGFWDVVRHTRKPFVASHSNCRELTAHPRNLTDEMLRTIGERGGIVGLNFCPLFLTDEGEYGSIESMLAHIRHVINVAGTDAVAIGTDFDGFPESVEIAHAGEMNLLEQALNRDGYSPAQIEKIMWRNAWRVVSEIL